MSTTKVAMVFFPNPGVPLNKADSLCSPLSVRRIHGSFAKSWLTCREAGVGALYVRVAGMPGSGWSGVRAQRLQVAELIGPSVRVIYLDRNYVVGGNEGHHGVDLIMTLVVTLLRSLNILAVCFPLVADRATKCMGTSHLAICTCKTTTALFI